MKNSAKKKEDEDDDVQMQGSEEEDEATLESPPMVELLRQNLRRLMNLLELAIPKNEIANSFDNSKAIPLGAIRLKVVELI